MEDEVVLPQLLHGLARAAEAEERRRWARLCAQAFAAGRPVNDFTRGVLRELPP